MASGTSPKRDKIILLLKQGETSPTVIANKVGCAVSYARLVKDEFLRSQKAPESPMGMEPCARCRAKGVIVCLVCQGTREIRNASYVVVGQCQDCREGRGFITCPNCLGKKVVDADRLREMRKLEAESMRSSPAVWGFTIPTPPRKIPVDVPAPPLDLWDFWLSSPTPSAPDGRRGLVVLPALVPPLRVNSFTKVTQRWPVES
jgi:hypothetical protein